MVIYVDHKTSLLYCPVLDPLGTAPPIIAPIQNPARNRGNRQRMKFGIQYQLNVVRPLDSDDWAPDDEHKRFQEALEQIEFADKLGFDYIFETEHHFLEEYSASSAPEVFLAAASQRTKNARLIHGIVQMPPKQNHPARVAERIATLDLVSNGRVEFGTGEGATETEIGGFGTRREDKKAAWEEATRECLRMMTMTPYPGYEGEHFSMPERNIVPKPLQKPHPPVWVAASRLETVMVGARLGMGAMGVGFETPEEAEERVSRYYELIRNCKYPIGMALNPALAAGGNMMMARTNEEAMRRGLRGAQFFGFALGFTNGEVHHGRDHLNREFVKRFGLEGDRYTNVTETEPDDETQRTLFRAGRRGNFIGSPEFVRENLRKYEDAHIDIMNFYIQVHERTHEHIMETLELFAKEVMPEFQERHHLHQKWREQQLDGVKFPINASI
jgi:alkanesulfonate monooxygenase SsuD/methylene tetrahydromethanopterin reductase-like flavin-dependent oxidoreductase (luciferase family)